MFSKNNINIVKADPFLEKKEAKNAMFYVLQSDIFYEFRRAKEILRKSHVKDMKHDYFSSYIFRFHLMKQIFLVNFGDMHKQDLSDDNLSFLQDVKTRIKDHSLFAENLVCRQLKFKSKNIKSTRNVIYKNNNKNRNTDNHRNTNYNKNRNNNYNRNRNYNRNKNTHTHNNRNTTQQRTWRTWRTTPKY